MKLISVGKGQALGLIIKWNGVTIMLDCGLDLSPLLHFLPAVYVKNHSSQVNKSKSFKLLHEIGNFMFLESNEMKIGVPDWSLVDLSRVDVLLISNHYNMLALPYLTEYTNFRGEIYATEPTIQIGRQSMKELVIHLEDQFAKLKQSTDLSPSNWQNTEAIPMLPPVYQQMLQGAWRWKSIYTQQEVLRAITRVKPLSYHESKSIFSLVKVTPVSSGLCLGGANWIIETSHEKLVYLSDSSLITGRFPEIIDAYALGKLTSVLKSESEKFDKNTYNSPPADVLIASPTSIAERSQTPPDARMHDFLAYIGLAINNGGNVLIPTYSSGIIFDLFEKINNYTLSQRSTKCPMFFISPVAEHSLAYANIIAEWLSKDKQEKVYLPEAPFPHEDMITNQSLFYFKTMNDLFNSGQYSEPCIVFTGHPTLRCGDVCNFIQLWGKHPANTILFVEPGIPYEIAIAPYQPLACRIVHCPLDWRLSTNEMNSLLREIKPKQVIVPHSFTVDAKFNPVPESCPTTAYNTLDTIKISFHRRFESGAISSNLAKQLKPISYGDVAVTDLSAILTTFDYKYFLDQATIPDLNTMQLYRERYVCGSPTTQSLIENLKKKGFVPNSCDYDAPSNTWTVSYEKLSAKVTISAQRTTIICSKGASRKLLSDAILTQCEDLTSRIW